ncbi:MAG: LuxR family transcriptional regulator [Catenulispora sp.]|nr:LuxR family transcriptional regulator [Catenulispora sp.]
MRGALGWAPTRARLLPPDLTDFTGRPAELALLTDCGSFPAQGAALFAVTGAGGTGKTALAVRAARLAGGAFPDAHLYADLGGYAGVPVAVPDVLRRFLRALGADGPLPEDPDELVGMFRTALAGQRVLVVLDDAADEAQVRPLLPAGPTALAVVTSRNWLGGLAGAVPLRLGPMPEAEAAAMLARVLGPRWTGEEDARDLLALCGHLPLAIRIAAARLLSRPQMSVGDLCDQLRDEGRRLRRLTAGDITVRGVLASSYEALEEGDRKLFRRLALLRGYDFGTDAAAVAAGMAREEAREALDRLADRSVVRAESPPGRYSLHSLARLFAADRLAADEEPGAVCEAEARHLDWVMARLHAAADLVNPCLVRLPRAGHGVGGVEVGGTDAKAGSGDAGGGAEARSANARAGSGGADTRTEAGGSTGSGGTNAGTESGGMAEAERGSALHSDRAADPAAGVLLDRDAALAWLDAERHNLLALVRHHRRTGAPTVCWAVPDALRGYFHARRHLREWIRMAGIGLAAATSAGNQRAQAAMHLGLGMAEYAGGRIDMAEEHYHRTVELGLGSGWREGEAAAYRNLAGVALMRGDCSASEKYMSLWADLTEVLGLNVPAKNAANAKRAAAAACVEADAEAAESADADDPTGPDPLAADWSSLSHREQAVARLVVQGLTNQQIAKRIRCSPETVKFHLRNIFRKLDIGSRVEIARFVLVPGGPT